MKFRLEAPQIKLNAILENKDHDFLQVCNTIFLFTENSSESISVFRLVDNARSLEVASWHAQATRRSLYSLLQHTVGNGEYSVSNSWEMQGTNDVTNWLRDPSFIRVVS